MTVFNLKFLFFRLGFSFIHGHRSICYAPSNSCECAGTERRGSTRGLFLSSICFVPFIFPSSIPNKSVALKVAITKTQISKYQELVQRINLKKNANCQCPACRTRKSTIIEKLSRKGEEGFVCVVNTRGGNVLLGSYVITPYWRGR